MRRATCDVRQGRTFGYDLLKVSRDLLFFRHCAETVTDQRPSVRMRGERYCSQTVDTTWNVEEDQKMPMRGRSSLGEGWPLSLKGVGPGKLKTTWGAGVVLRSALLTHSEVGTCAEVLAA